MQNEQIDQLTEIGQVYDIRYNDGTTFTMKRIGTNISTNEPSFEPIEAPEKGYAETLYNDFDWYVTSITPAKL